jgi:hypothetical protein
MSLVRTTFASYDPEEETNVGERTIEEKIIERTD